MAHQESAFAATNGRQTSVGGTTHGGYAVRIALVHSFYRSRYPSGENEVVRGEVAALRRAGHEVHLVHEHTDRLERSPTHAFRSAMRVATHYGNNPISELHELRPDVVHVHNLFPNYSRRWAAKVPVPIVATLHNFRLVCANGTLFRDGAICTDCVGNHGMAATVHGCYRDSRLATLPLSLGKRPDVTNDPLVANAARVILLSTRMAEVMSQAGLRRDRIAIWPNFLPASADPHTLGLRPSDSTTNDWLFVGRLSEEKGIAQLLDRWPADAHLTVVGDGPIGPRIRADAPRNIRFLGTVSRTKVLALMAEATGLVVPSLWLEGFPVIYPEAMASALPILALEGNTVSDLVHEEGTGICATWQQDLSRALARIVSRREELSTACRRTFEERYSEDAYVRRANELYSALVH